MNDLHTHARPASVHCRKGSKQHCDWMPGAGEWWFSGPRNSPLKLDLIAPWVQGEGAIGQGAWREVRKPDG